MVTCGYLRLLVQIFWHFKMNTWLLGINIYVYYIHTHTVYKHDQLYAISRTILFVLASPKHYVIQHHTPIY